MPPDRISRAASTWGRDVWGDGGSHQWLPQWLPPVVPDSRSVTGTRPLPVVVPMARSSAAAPVGWSSGAPATEALGGVRRPTDRNRSRWIEIGDFGAKRQGQVVRRGQGTV